MKWCVGMHQRIDRARRHRRLAEAAEDQLQLARIAHDIADREDARQVGGAGRRIDGNQAALEIQPPLGE